MIFFLFSFITGEQEMLLWFGSLSRGSGSTTTGFAIFPLETSLWQNLTK